MKAPLLGLIFIATTGCGTDASDATPTSGVGGSSVGGSGSGGVGGSGVGGSGSSVGGNGGSGAGGEEPVGSEGCGVAVADATEQWVPKTVEVNGASREFFVRLPAGYDTRRAYPVVYQFHGCSNQPAKENNNPPVHEQSGPDAIVVRGRAVDNCWDISANGSDVAFFDALVDAVESSFCADPDRRFAAGYSSGAFMSHRLACDRGEALRGVASIAGGLAGNACEGQVAALLIHDQGDETVDISQSENARDRHLANNGCDDDAPTTPWGPAPCVAYAGCDPGHPVIWCETTGQNHSRQDGLSAPAFWQLFSTL